MALDFGTSFNPYSEDELNTLSGLMGIPDPAAAPPAQYPEPQAPMLEAQAPVAAPEPVMPQQAPLPTTPIGQPQGFEPPAPAAPLDLSMPAAQPTAPKGLVRSGYAVEGIPGQERDKLTQLHQQLAAQEMGNIDASAQTEAGVLEGQHARAQKRVEDANVKANTNQMALAGQQAARQKLEQEGAEWSKVKEDPGKAFEGIEWAGVLAAIGIGAGTFAQAMGWQRDNPVLEQFNKAVDRSIAAQREQKNSRLQNIRERIGDSQAAEQLLSAQLHDAIADRAEAEMQRATTEDAQKRLGDMVKAERQKVQEGVVAAYERMVPKEQQQFAPPKPAGAGKDPIARMAELASLDKALEERGAGLDNPIRQQIRAELAGISGKTAPEQQREDAANKTTDEQSKALGAYNSIQQLGNEAGLKRNQDGSFVVEDSLGSRLNLPELGESISGAFGGAKPIANAREAAKEGIGRLMSGGVIGKDEEVAFKKMLGDASSRRQLADALNKIQVVVEPRLKPSDLEREKNKNKPPSREAAGFKPQGR